MKLTCAVYNCALTRTIPGRVRTAGNSKDRQQTGLPGISGEPGGPVYRESVVKRLIFPAHDVTVVYKTGLRLKDGVLFTKAGAGVIVGGL